MPAPSEPFAGTLGLAVALYARKDPCKQETGCAESFQPEIPVSAEDEDEPGPV